MKLTRRRGVLAAVACSVAVGLVVVSPAQSLAALRRILESPAFPVILVGLYLLRPFFAWPITALSVLVGYRYGVFPGVPIALLGAAGTSLIPYGIAARFSPEEGLFGKFGAGCEQFFDGVGDLRGVVAARLAPTPAEAISLAAGSASVSLPAFLLGTLVGELPWTLLAVTAGASMDQLTLEGAIDLRMVVLGGVAGGLLLLGPAYRVLNGHSGSAES